MSVSELSERKRERERGQMRERYIDQFLYTAINHLCANECYGNVKVFMFAFDV